jgi:4-hydroxy-3-polyprenylbenzoate decarboxylase
MGGIGGHTLTAMYPNLRSFVQALEAAGELRRIRGPVDPVLEVARLADAESKKRCPGGPTNSARRVDPRLGDRGGQALLIERPARPAALGGGTYDIPIAINVWGSYRRMEMALGCHEAVPGVRGGHTPGGFDGLGAKIGELVKPEPPKSLGDLVRKARLFLPLLRIPPRRRGGDGPSQEVVQTSDAVNLFDLPIIRCWPLDGDFASLGYPAGLNDGIVGLGHQGSKEEWNAEFRGRYITLAGIHTVHADDRDSAKPSSHNIGMYRVQLLGRRTLAMHWHMHHDGARHWRSWKKLGKPMPVAIVLGGESVMPYAATAPLPPGISELLLAGFLNRGGIPMVRAKTVPLWVPANAEIVIEGYVSAEAGGIGWVPGEPGAGELGPGAVFEGPFGDHTGFYSLPDRYPLLNVTAITRRKDAIYPTTVVGLPPQEDYFLGKATERIFLPLLRTLIHDIEDYDLPMFGTFHNCAMIRIRKAYPLQGRRVMHSVWGAGQMAWTKSIFVVDDDVDVHDTMKVLRLAGEQCHPLRDVELVNGPLDILDHAAPRLAAGMKIGFDCTRKVAGEEVGGVAVEERALPTLAGREAMDRYVAEVARLEGVVAASVPSEAPGWLLVSVRKAAGGMGKAFMPALWRVRPAGVDVATLPRFVIVVGEDVDVTNVDAVFFAWLAHSDSSRDMYRWSSEPEPARAAHRLAFDATAKVAGDERHGQPVRRWPPILGRMERL